MAGRDSEIGAVHDGADSNPVCADARIMYRIKVS